VTDAPRRGGNFDVAGYRPGDTVSYVLDSRSIRNDVERIADGVLWYRAERDADDFDGTFYAYLDLDCTRLRIKQADPRVRIGDEVLPFVEEWLVGDDAGYTCLRIPAADHTVVYRIVGWDPSNRQHLAEWPD
jgi:hypothetical protein